MGAPDTTEPKPFPWVGLFTLSALIFMMVTSEFLPTGLLPEIAQQLDVSESQVGLLITVFAGTVVLTAAPLSILTRHYSRKSLVIVVLIVFVLGNVLAALAPSYPVLVVARVIGGLAHGLFWSVVGAYSAHLVPKHQLARAVSITGGGGTAAFVLGVPLGTALGHSLGWRLAFGILAGAVVVLTIVTARLLPPVSHGETLGTGEIPLPMRKDSTVPGVIIVGVIVVLVALGHNLFYTYIAPFLIGPVGFDPGSVAGVLFLYGGAGAVGLVLAGTLGDRFPRGAMIGAIVFVLFAVTLLAGFANVQWVTLVAVGIWGASFGALPSLLQARMLHTASLRVRDVAAAYFTTSFNFAIGLGALLGGLLLDRVGVGFLPWVDIAITAVGLVLVVLGNAWLARRDAARRHP
ncbi:MAG: transporter [Rhodoglobus sp.]|nr:transporter [Rhodoglobus sp.]